MCNYTSTHPVYWCVRRGRQRRPSPPGQLTKTRRGVGRGLLKGPQGHKPTVHTGIYITGEYTRMGMATSHDQLTDRSTQGFAESGPDLLADRSVLWKCTNCGSKERSPLRGSCKGCEQTGHRYPYNK